MKFIHISDLHIGLKLLNRDLTEDQAYIFAQITEYIQENQPDAVVIAGDIYDKSVPSAEAVDLFDWFIGEIRKAAKDTAVFVISGNHDNPSRLNIFRKVLKDQNVYMIGIAPHEPEETIEKVTLSDEYGDVTFFLLPFVKPSMVKKITGSDENGNNLSYNETLRRLIEREEIDENKRNVLVSHQFYLPSGKDPDQVERMSSEIRTVGNIDEVDAAILKRFDYAALGHIHKPMSAGDERFRYSGTPMAYSFDEAGQEKAALLVELKEKGKQKITALPLKPLREVRVIKGSLEQILKEACEDYVSAVITGDDRVNEVDIRDRMKNAFPNLLEIRREGRELAYAREEYDVEAPPDPFELCCSFLGDPSEPEMQALGDVINTVLKM